MEETNVVVDIFDGRPHDAKSYYALWYERNKSNHKKWYKKYRAENKIRLNRNYREWYHNMSNREKEIYLARRRVTDNRRYRINKIKDRHQKLKTNLSR